ELERCTSHITHMRGGWGSTYACGCGWLQMTVDRFARDCVRQLLPPSTRSIFMRTGSRLIAVLGAAALSVGGVLGVGAAAMADEPLAELTVNKTAFEVGDTDWSGGVEFSATGFTPLTMIDVT